MSDAKHDYQLKGKLQRFRGKFFPKIKNALARGKTESQNFKANWLAVNINDLVAKFTPGAKGIPSLNGRKVYFYNFKTKIRLVTDVRGGYVRIEKYKSKSKRRYLGINGNDESNFINAKGKKQGRSRADYEAVTHFRILRRDEM